MTDWRAGMRISAERLQDTVGVWQDYPATWEASTSPSIGDGEILGRYMQVGSTVEFLLRITMGSSTTYGSGAYDLGLPVPPRTLGGSSVAAVASVVIEIGSSTNRYGFQLLMRSSGATRIVNGSTSGIDETGHDGHSWQAGNFILANGRYEVD